jgi:hypothetical protein
MSDSTELAKDIGAMATAQEFANANASDGAAFVNDVLINPTARTVTVRVSSEDADTGANALSLAFARAIGWDETRVVAQSTATWGNVVGAWSVPIAFSWDCYYGLVADEHRDSDPTVRVMLHHNPGTLEWLRVQLNDAAGNTEVARVTIGERCEQGGPRWSKQHHACVWSIPVDVDTTAARYDGFQELRISANVRQQNIDRMFQSTGWQAYLANGKAVNHRRSRSDGTPRDYIEARGWYDGAAYSNARLESRLPAVVSGVWEPEVRMEAGAGGIDVHRSFAALNPDFHHSNAGTVLLDHSGPYRGQLRIDTRKLPDGVHRLFLRADAPCDGSAGNDCGLKRNGSDNNTSTSSGALAIWFTVNNGGSGGTPPPTHEHSAPEAAPWATGVPISGDWNGDGHTTPGWYHNGRVYLRTSSTTGPPNIVFSYGRAGDRPVVGDWNGDGMDTIGIVRDRHWHLRFTNTSGPADRSFIYGRLTAGDYPLAGDWNRDGRDTIGIVRGGQWHLRNRLSGGGADVSFVYGRVLSGDVPLVGDWNRDGRDTPGIVRDGVWHLRNTNTGGVANTSFRYGRASDLPVVGDWNNNRQTTAGVVRGTTWHLRNTNTAGAGNLNFAF